MINKSGILYCLAYRSPVPMSLGWICEELGVKRNRRGGYSCTAYAKYKEISAALQALKREGRVRYVGGKGAGWVLP